MGGQRHGPCQHLPRPRPSRPPPVLVYGVREAEEVVGEVGLPAEGGSPERRPHHVTI